MVVLHLLGLVCPLTPCATALVLCKLQVQRKDRAVRPTGELAEQGAGGSSLYARMRARGVSADRVSLQLVPCLHFLCSITTRQSPCVRLPRL
jgi:hypothetical protein